MTITEVVSKTKYTAVVRRQNPSYVEFEQSYLRPNKPIILEGATLHWKALGKWTPAFFRQLAHLFSEH